MNKKEIKESLSLYKQDILDVTNEISKFIKSKKFLRENQKYLKTCKSDYDEILNLLAQYQDDYRNEIRDLDLNGHKHFLTEEVEKKIINLINQNENVLLIRDYYGQNIGMRCCGLKLENVVIRTLDNHKASLQQNLDGRNIGMWAASYKLKEATLKALDNSEASLQQDMYGQNIGMWAVGSNIEEAVLKALDNKEASLQQNQSLLNLGMMCCLIYPHRKPMERAVLKALENSEASLQQDRDGYNIGMWSAANGLREATLKALDNTQASLQQNAQGKNIGMICATTFYKEGALKAVENVEAVKQTDLNGDTILTLSDRSNLDEVREKWENMKDEMVSDSFEMTK